MHLIAVDSKTRTSSGNQYGASLSKSNEEDGPKPKNNISDTEVIGVQSKKRGLQRRHSFSVTHSSNIEKDILLSNIEKDLLKVRRPSQDATRQSSSGSGGSGGNYSGSGGPYGWGYSDLDAERRTLSNVSTGKRAMVVENVFDKAGDRDTKGRRTGRKTSNKAPIYVVSAQSWRSSRW